MEALRGTEQFNQGLRILLKEARLGRRWIGNSFRAQLVLKCIGCKPHHQHFRYVCPKAIRNEQDLWCMYCLGETEQWGSKKRATALERAAMNLLEAADLLERFAWQVRPTWWTGQVDFYHISEQLVVQIDGQGHVEGQWYKDSRAILQLDIDCCLAAYAARAKVARISHIDVLTPAFAEIIRQAIQSSSRHFIVLSRAYTSLKCKDTSDEFDFVHELQKQLPMAGAMTVNTGTYGEVWLTW